MTRPRISEGYRQFVLRQIDRANFLRDRKRRLYNRFYRKSLLFVSSWIVRLTYFLLFIIVLIFYKTTGSSRNEILQNVYEEDIWKGASKKKSYSGERKIFLVTNYDTYTGNADFVDIRTMAVNDTLIIERNIFGKPIHYTKRGWQYKYGIHKNYIFYYFVLFLTFISFFFNDGLDRFGSKLLYVFYVLNILSIVLFFIT